MAGGDALCHTSTPKTGVALATAAIHTRDEFEERLPYWQKHGLLSTYRPMSAPELNLSAILGRRITYPWLPCSADECLNAWRAALEPILSHVGSQDQCDQAMRVERQ
jgi:hypothetical protein